MSSASEEQRAAEPAEGFVGKARAAGPLFPIVTGRRVVPWLWVFLITFPWMTNVMREQISNTGMAFTLKKFIDNPALIGAILSTNMAFSMTVGALVAYVSDHVWTRWGRRRPFILASLLFSSVLGLFIPIFGNFWLVVAAIVLFQLFADFGTPFEPLVNEVVPPKQRGRNGAITAAYKAVGMTLVLSVLIGGFDNQYELLGISISGEFVMYFGLVILSGLCFCLLAFQVKETPPKEPVPGWRSLSPVAFFKRILSMRFLPLFGLMFVMQNLWSSLGPYEALLITEQWGFAKSEYGDIMSISFLTGMALLPLAGWLSDRFDRLMLLTLGLVFVLVCKSGFYVYTDLVIDGERPWVGLVYLYGFIKSGIAAFLSVACVPLIFDYVKRGEMGTLACGISLVLGGVSFVGVNASGSWITLASDFIYGYPEGKYNYLAGFHYLILTGLLGLAYLFYFRHLNRTGRVTKEGLAEAGVREDGELEEGAGKT